MSENTTNEPFKSEYEDAKDSSASQPIAADQALVTPDNNDVSEDDSAEAKSSDVPHEASPEDVDKAADSESSA